MNIYSCSFFFTGREGTLTKLKTNVLFLRVEKSILPLSKTHVFKIIHPSQTHMRVRKKKCSLFLSWKFLVNKKSKFFFPSKTSLKRGISPKHVRDTFVWLISELKKKETCSFFSFQLLSEKRNLFCVLTIDFGFFLSLY